jgi:hypothetical protein
MHGAPFDVGERGLAVDDVAEHVEHPGENFFAHRSFERAARVHHDHSAGQTLRRRQRDPTHAVSISVGQHFDDDSIFIARAKQRVDGRQVRIESNVDDATAHRDDHTAIR